MVFKGEVYRFEIYYIENGKEEDIKTLYADSDNIYELEDVPRTAHCIYVYHRNFDKKENYWDFVGEYRVGEKITLEEAKNEIKALEDLHVEEKDETAKIRAYHKLNSYYLNSKNNSQVQSADNIYINKSIDLTGGSISARIIIMPSTTDYKIISPSQIINGKIYPVLNSNFCLNGQEREKNPNSDWDKPYIDLE